MTRTNSTSATPQLLNTKLWNIILSKPKLICINHFDIKKVFDIMWSKEVTKDYEKYYFLVDYNGKYKTFMLTDIDKHTVLHDVTMGALYDLHNQGWKMTFNTFLKNKRYKSMLENHTKGRNKYVENKKFEWT